MGTWGYSTNGGEWWSTGYASRDEAFGDALQERDCFSTAFCEPNPLSFDVADDDDISEFVIVGHTAPEAARWLVELFVERNEDCDFEGEAFADAKPDEQLVADLGCDLTPDICEAALRAWAERSGGFEYGRTLNTTDEVLHTREEVVLARIIPGERDYDWEYEWTDDMGRRQMLGLDNDGAPYSSQHWNGYCDTPLYWSAL